MAHTFTQVMEKLNKKSYTPTLLFTPEKNGGGDKHVDYGFYEVEGCSLGPVMLRYYERRLCDGTPYTCAAVRVRKSNFEDWVPDYTGNANFNSVHTFLFNVRNKGCGVIKKTNLEYKDVMEKWNNFLQKPIQGSELNAFEREYTAFDFFEAVMNVANRHRPYEPSDFVKETYIPDLAVAVPVIIGAAIKFAPMVQQYMMMTAHSL